MVLFKTNLPYSLETSCKSNCDLTTVFFCTDMISFIRCCKNVCTKWETLFSLNFIIVVYHNFHTLGNKFTNFLLEEQKNTNER